MVHRVHRLRMVHRLHMAQYSRLLVVSRWRWGSGVLEQGGVEGGLRAAAAVAVDDVTDHVLPSDMGKRGRVTLQLPPLATVDHHLSDQKTWTDTKRIFVSKCFINDEIYQWDQYIQIYSCFFFMTKTRTS